MKITTKACCKINIGLNIVSKRADGYHNLETVFYPVPLYDRIDITDADADIIDLAGHPLEGDPNDNLVLKAVWELTALSLSVAGPSMRKEWAMSSHPFGLTWPDGIWYWSNRMIMYPRARLIL